MNKSIKEQAETAYKAHKACFENWNEGEIIDYWIDDAGNLCIRYESGNWWRYKYIEAAMPSWVWW